MSKAIFKYVKEGANEEDIEKIETFFQVKLPDTFKMIIKENDGGYPKPNVFVKKNGQEESVNDLISYNLSNEENVIKIYGYVKDRMLHRIIPFADDGGGNMICFDYRNRSIPQISFWDHEKASSDVNNGMMMICDTIEEFFDMLYEADDD